MPGMLFYYDVDDPRPMPIIGKNLPAADYSFSYWDREHPDKEQREYLCLRAGETLPQHFAGMFYAKRDAFRKVLSECQPKHFCIFSVRSKSEYPTPMWELRPDNHFWKIGEVADESGGGYYPIARGSFDETPSAGTLAYIACRLAADQRWLVLAPTEKDRFSTETLALMNNFDPAALQPVSTIVDIKPPQITAKLRQTGFTT